LFFVPLQEKKWATYLLKILNECIMKQLSLVATSSTSERLLWTNTEDGGAAVKASESVESNDEELPFLLHDREVCFMIQSLEISSGWFYLSDKRCKSLGWQQVEDIQSCVSWLSLLEGQLLVVANGASTHSKCSEGSAFPSSGSTVMMQLELSHEIASRRMKAAADHKSCNGPLQGTSDDTSFANTFCVLAILIQHPVPDVCIAASRVLCQLFRIQPLIALHFLPTVLMQLKPAGTNNTSLSAYCLIDDSLISNR
jgi:hypothetical protein